MVLISYFINIKYFSIANIFIKIFENKVYNKTKALLVIYSLTGLLPRYNKL